MKDLHAGVHVLTILLYGYTGATRHHTYILQHRHHNTSLLLHHHSLRLCHKAKKNKTKTLPHPPSFYYINTTFPPIILGLHSINPQEDKLML